MSSVPPHPSSALLNTPGTKCRTWLCLDRGPYELVLACGYLIKSGCEGKGKDHSLGANHKAQTKILDPTEENLSAWHSPSSDSEDLAEEALQAALREGALQRPARLAVDGRALQTPQ